MSVGKKIVDGARAGLGSLLDRITPEGAALSGIGGLELERELLARKALRERRGGKPPEDNPLARAAAGGPEAAKLRAQAAAERQKTLGAERARKRAADEAATAAAAETARRSASASSGGRGGIDDDAFKKFREDVKSGRVKPGPAPRPGGAAGAGGGSSGGAGFGRVNEKLAKAYRTLDLQPGAGLAEVKAQYRKLMRKYHPDMHTANPAKQKAATELSMQVTDAYNQVAAHLDGK